MGQSSVRGEGTRGRVPRARELGWDDDLHGAGEATGAKDGAPEEEAEADAPVPARASRRRGGHGGGTGAGGRAASRRRAKKTGKRKVLRWTAITLSLLILGTAGAGYLYYEHLNGNIRGGDRAGGNSGVKKSAPNAMGDTPLNILLIGSDSRADAKNVALGGGKDLRNNPPLADVQMLLHVSADRKNASLVSIPRDTIVHIPECKDKNGTTYPATDNRPINETLMRGGPGCTLTTWEELTKVYIDHWMMVDFAGVVAIADEVGGVPVCVKTGVYDHPTARVKGGSGLKLRAGTTEIQGKQALQWLRTRHPFYNDQGRAKAQHMYLNGMMEKLQSQNAWTDTGRLMGLAETATESLQVSDELKSVKKLFDLAMQLKNVKLNRLTTANIPTAEWSQDHNKNVLIKKSADKMFAMLRDDIAFDKNGDPADAKPKPTASTKPKATAGAPGSLAVAVVNGTGSDTEPAAEGRARTIAELLQGKGFTEAKFSQEGGNREDTVVAYPKADADQGKANALSVAKALGLPDSAVRADAKVEGITLTIGADWREGSVYKHEKPKAGDLPEGSDVVQGDQKECMPVYSAYYWDGKS
ncbi:LCP family protein [Streptomyces sp. NPDC006197]|uniref:LCP family protein n=1 Tax=Streptomyces sp. NPDC006197 TaxID=3156685 RepID=UPI0033B5FAC9